MDSSQIAPPLTEQSEAEPPSQLITLLQRHVAPGYTVGGRWDYVEDIAFQKRETEVEARATASYAVVEALAAKNSPAIRDRDATMKAEGRAEGRVAGVAESVLKVLEARGIPVTEAQRQEILGCQDLNRVNQWLDRAVMAPSADEVTSEP